MALEHRCLLLSIPILALVSLFPFALAFMMLNVELSLESSRRDDLESLAYMLIYFIRDRKSVGRERV